MGYTNDNYSPDLDKLLLYACENNSLLIVEKTIHDGADIHYEEDLPLALASFYGNLDIVNYLVESGADIRSCSNFAIRIAKMHGHKEVESYLTNALKESNF